MAGTYIRPSGKIYYFLFASAFAVLCALTLLLSAVMEFSPYLIMAVLVAMLAIACAATYTYFQYFYIHVEDEIITVREGAVSSKMVVIPFNKISGVESRRGPLDSIFGLGTLMIDTSGSAGVEVEFRNTPQESISIFMDIFRKYKDGEKTGPAKEEAKREERDSW
ncbi:MAG: PH domain-containing protein [Candidatus ainarchaeum sp.]|nr:PH domain-containing protein [Candidatus ainarchaeum sp.]